MCIAFFVDSRRYRGNLFVLIFVRYWFYCSVYLRYTSTAYLTLPWLPLVGYLTLLISLTPPRHFLPFHRRLDISREITAESSPLLIASSRTQAGNLWFPNAYP